MHAQAVNEEGMGDTTDGRGGVDDLIDLVHLHEPAILHVLVRSVAPVVFPMTDLQFSPLLTNRASLACAELTSALCYAFPSLYCVISAC